MDIHVTERFAPSPTGALHLGHAFSALTAHDAARAAGGRFLLRMEDLDQSRVRPGFADAILEDLAWLGLDWDDAPVVQSQRLDLYGAALSKLAARGLTYACRCSRKDISEAVAAPQETTAGMGPDGPAYPGTCRDQAYPDAGGVALRLNMRKAIDTLGGGQALGALDFTERGAGPAGETGRIGLDPVLLMRAVGDVVLRRKDGMPAYHLAVVVDDAAQGVTVVTRGRDLFSSTSIHRLLQALLELPVPGYRHHRLIRDADGRRLAKRAPALSLRRLRSEGATPTVIRERLGMEAPAHRV